MKILISNLKEGVCTEVQHRYNPRDLELELADLKYLKDIALNGTLEIFADTLTFRGNLTTAVDHICGRCLEHITSEVNQPFELFYPVKDVEELDTTDDIRELLLIDSPMIFLCRPDCKGLCPKCGVNLNETPCKCQEKPQAPTLASLRMIWENRKNPKKPEGGKSNA